MSDTEGEDTRLKRIWHTRHWADQWQAIRRVGDGAVDHFVDAGLAQKRHTRHGVLNVPFKAIKVVWIKLEGEVIRHRVVRCDPMCFAVALIRAEVQAVLFLTQVVRRVHIAQEGEFVLPVFLAPGFDFRDFVGQQILVAHYHHRHGAPAIGFEPLADALGIVTRSIDHIFAADIAFGCVDDPFAVFTANASRLAESFNPGTHIAGTFGQCLG